MFTAAKIMQTSAMEACFQIVECSLSSAKVQVVTGKEEQESESLAWVEAGHSYPEKGVNYTITICSEEEDAIIGFDGCGMFEVKTLDVILTECPSLRILRYSGYGGELLDVSKNPLLEFIDFSEIRNVKLDFSANFGDDKIKGVPCLER